MARVVRVPVGLALLGWSIVDFDIPRTAAVHALTAGAMATMILAVMTRATLGHTGRALVASPQTTFLYFLVTTGAALRVSAPIGVIDYMIGLQISGIAWTGGLKYRGKFDETPEVVRFAETLERVCIETVESGKMTKDLALLIGPGAPWLTTQEFLGAINENLQAAMA